MELMYQLLIVNRLITEVDFFRLFSAMFLFLSNFFSLGNVAGGGKGWLSQLYAFLQNAAADKM